MKPWNRKSGRGTVSIRHTAPSRFEGGLVQWRESVRDYRGDHIGIFTYNNDAEVGQVDVDSFNYRYDSPATGARSQALNNIIETYDSPKAQQCHCSGKKVFRATLTPNDRKNHNN